MQECTNSGGGCTEIPSGRSGGSIENSKSRRDRHLCGNGIDNGIRDARAGSSHERQRHAQLPRGSGRAVYVTTQYSAPVTFYSGTPKRYTSGYTYNAVFNYGTRTVNWRVETTGNIQT